jgi:uncharacterized protein (TIGR03086 family)
MRSMDPLTGHQRAQDAFASVLANVRPDQLDAPTPCAEWTVRDVVEHVIAGNVRMAGGKAAGATESRDIGQLVEAHAQSAQDAQQCFAAPDGLTRPIELPFGTVPGVVVIGLRTTDALTHAWDVARATGQPTDLDPEIAAEMLAVSRERIQPSFRGPGRPFAEEHPCDEERPAADRLAAFLGRAVD